MGKQGSNLREQFNTGKQYPWGAGKSPITGEVEENKARIQKHTGRINHEEKAGRSAHKRREHKD